MTQTVLVVETEMASAAALASNLASFGFKPLAAHDSVHALTVARQAQPDVVLLNSRVAGGGTAALRRIRSNVYTTNIPVIVLTSHDHERQDFINTGAQACVPRQSDYKVIVQAIKDNMLQSLDFTQAPAAVLQDPKRMAALHAAHLLDTPPAKELDALTKLTSRLLDVPVSLFALVDKDRQFFKSQIGLAQPWSGQRQSRLSHSFCQWVVSSGESLSVSDAREHPVLKNNLAIKDMGVIAYAGVPISTPSQQHLGSFCAVHSEPRAWTPEDLLTLTDFARIVEAISIAPHCTDSGSQADMAKQIRPFADGISGATRVLRRYESTLTSEERLELLSIIEVICGLIGAGLASNAVSLKS